jgi:carbon storage regulator
VLVMTRRAGETIIIAGNIQVHILGINGSQVRVGVDAPKSVTVDREEIHQRKLERPDLKYGGGRT